MHCTHTAHTLHTHCTHTAHTPHVHLPLHRTVGRDVCVGLGRVHRPLYQRGAVRRARPRVRGAEHFRRARRRPRPRAGRTAAGGAARPAQGGLLLPVAHHGHRRHAAADGHGARGPRAGSDAPARGGRRAHVLPAPVAALPAATLQGVASDALPRATVPHRAHHGAQPRARRRHAAPRRTHRARRARRRARRHGTARAAPGRGQARLCVGGDAGATLLSPPCHLATAPHCCPSLPPLTTAPHDCPSRLLLTTALPPASLGTSCC